MKALLRKLPVVFLCLGVLGVLGVLAGCSGYDSDIKAVKKATTAGTSNAEFVDQLAGVRGSVEWSAGESEKYADQKDIVVVAATVKKTSRAGAKHTIVLRYIHNRGNSKVALDEVLVDGEQQGILGGALQVLLLQLE